MTRTTDDGARAATRAARIIAAPPDRIYAAFMDPAALAEWLPPARMTGTIHSFDGRVGGGYTMTLAYPPDEDRFRGKTTAREDRVTVRFLALEPGRRILEAVTFDTTDPAFMGEMRIEITLSPVAGGTEVAFLCSDLPPGLRPEDNEAGSRLSLDQLARRLA